MIPCKNIIFSGKNLVKFPRKCPSGYKNPGNGSYRDFYIWFRNDVLCYALFFPKMLRRTKSVPIIRTIAMGRETMLWVKPAIM